MTDHAIARRGDLVAFTARHSSSSLTQGTTYYETAHIGVAAHVTRNGHVKGIAGHREFHSPLIVGSNRLRATPQEIIDRIGPTFNSLDEIRTALKPFIKDERELAFDALSPSARRTVSEMRGGALLCKTQRPPTEEDEAEALWFLHPTNKRVVRATAEAIVKGGFAQPNRDGLFDDGTSQTWRAA